jgi:hypothetical protein
MCAEVFHPNILPLFRQDVKTDPNFPSSVLTQIAFQILATVGTSKPVPKIKYKTTEVQMEMSRWEK